nr:hypothetical protein [Tanacetum cinerariifolium]
VPEIYMQEFWVTATVHHHSIRFKMDNKKHIVNLEYLREMLHICPRLPGQTFDEPPFEEKILAFLRSLRRSGEIRRLTDVEHKDTKKSNEMYYPRFTKVIIHHFMSKDPLIPRRNKFGAMLPIELTHADIKNTDAYKEYYAVATGATLPKTKASVRKTKSSSGTTVTPPPTAAAGTILFTSAKGKQPATTSKAKSLTALSKVAITEAEQLKLATKRSLQQIYISQASGSGEDEGTSTIPGVLDEGSNDEQASDEEGEEFIHPSLSTHDEEETRDEESFDPIPKTPKNTDDEGNGEENLRMNVSREEGQDEEDEEDELYRDVNIHLSSSVSSQFVTSMLNPTPDVRIESIFKTSSQMDVQPQTTVAPLPLSEPTLTPSTIATVTTIQQAPTLPTTTLSTLLQDLPNFGSLFGFDHRLKTLEAKFSEFMQTNQFARAVSSILRIVQRYMDQRMNEAVKVAVQIQFDRLRDKAQAENEEFLKTIDENMQKIIKEQTSYAVAADLSEMELKKIIIEKMEGNKSIHRSNEQRNLYKALVEAYKSDKIILDTYGDTVTLNRRRDDDADKDEKPSAGSDRGSKRRREGKEPDESATAEEPMQTTHEIEEPLHPEFETGADDQPIAEPSQHPKWFSQQKKPPTPDRDWNKTLPATHESIQPWISELAKQTDSRSSFNELMDTLVDFSDFLMNRLKVDTLTPELLAGPTYELMKGSCKSLVELEFFLEEVYKAITDKLDWTKAVDYGHIKRIEDLVPRTMWIQESVGYDKHALWGISHWGCKRQQFYAFAVNKESARDVYSKRRIIAVTELKIVEWHNYKNLDWITRLRIQDIEDMLLLLVQGKLTNLTVEERFALNVSLRMFTRSIVIQRCVEYLQLGVESYQKKLNLTRPDTYRSDLKRNEAYIAYSNPRGFIY